MLQNYTHHRRITNKINNNNNNSNINNGNYNDNNFTHPGKRKRWADQIDPLVSTGDQQYKLQNIKVELTILEYNYYKEIKNGNYK